MSVSLVAFVRLLECQKRKYTYLELADHYNVNQRYLWELLNTPEYIPPAKVRRKLGIVLEERPPRISIYKDAAHIDQTIETIKKHLSPGAIRELKRRL